MGKREATDLITGKQVTLNAVYLCMVLVLELPPYSAVLMWCIFGTFEITFV